jgi:alkanesulfonate monooxygenase SsuD/methylene tetrahydromethanopterin reductase-like flavin-dependent oxidoreductase (luciferase family)
MTALERRDDPVNAFRRELAVIPRLVGWIRGSGVHGEWRVPTVRERTSLAFGLNIDPVIDRPWEIEALAQLADTAGLALVAMQDHAYNPRFAETWTVLTAVALRTQRVHVLMNVATLALRPAPMLAKAAATLDRLTGGRVELGIGSGGIWDGIAAMGGPRWSPGEALAAIEDALRLCRLLWERAKSGEPVTYEGPIFRVDHLVFGPAPTRPVPLWVGAIKPRALRLAGELADGITVSTPYVLPEKLPQVNQWVNEGAERVGRDPATIRRLYNLLGVLDVPGGRSYRVNRPGLLGGPADAWADAIARFAELGMDTFVFWPVAGDYLAQARHFVEEVIPRVRDRVGSP